MDIRTINIKAFVFVSERADIEVILKYGEVVWAVCTVQIRTAANTTAVTTEYFIHLGKALRFTQEVKPHFTGDKHQLDREIFVFVIYSISAMYFILNILVYMMFTLLKLSYSSKRKKTTFFPTTFSFLKNLINDQRSTVFTIMFVLFFFFIDRYLQGKIL